MLGQERGPQVRAQAGARPGGAMPAAENQLKTVTGLSARGSVCSGTQANQDSWFPFYFWSPGSLVTNNEEDISLV